MPRRGSVFARFHLAGAGLMIAVGLIGAVFYGVVSSHYFGQMLGRTLGPYTDALAKAGLESEDPELWGQMAARHGVAILVEPTEGEPRAWDERGTAVAPSALAASEAPIRVVRTAADGTRLTFHWQIVSFGGRHVWMLGGLLLLMIAVVGAAFWYLRRQLRPLAALQTGVEAVSRGDFDARVPVVRDDEIGRVATAFNDMAGRVGGMIDDRERLLADVSHELRSPIARMKVALELSPVGDKRDALARDLGEMEELVAALLERERLRSDGELEGEAVDLVALAGEAIAPALDVGPGVELSAGGVATVQGDPALLKRLVHNLVDNAIKFSLPDSRPVVVEIEAAPETRVLRVVDDGRGVPTGSEDELFEPFVKTDPSRGHHAGYGLGLNICQRIAHLHGGTIELLPNSPRGTQAVVTLPAPAWL